MRITYDKLADAQYIYIKRTKIVHTEKVEDWLLLDRDKDGDVVGIEILSPSRHTLDITNGTNGVHPFLIKEPS